MKFTFVQFLVLLAVNLATVALPVGCAVYLAVRLALKPSKVAGKLVAPKVVKHEKL